MCAACLPNSSSFILLHISFPVTILKHQHVMLIHSPHTPQVFEFSVNILMSIKFGPPTGCHLWCFGTNLTYVFVIFLMSLTHSADIESILANEWSFCQVHYLHMMYRFRDNDWKIRNSDPCVTLCYIQSDCTVNTYVVLLYALKKTLY